MRSRSQPRRIDIHSPPRLEPAGKTGAAQMPNAVAVSRKSCNATHLVPRWCTRHGTGCSHCESSSPTLRVRARPTSVFRAAVLPAANHQPPPSSAGGHAAAHRFTARVRNRALSPAGRAGRCQLGTRPGPVRARRHHQGRKSKIPTGLRRTASSGSRSRHRLEHRHGQLHRQAGRRWSWSSSPAPTGHSPTCRPKG